MLLAREPDSQRAAFELCLARPERCERRRQHDVALVAAHAHDQLEPDLLEVDLRLLDERDAQPQLGARTVHHQLLAEVVVEDLLRVVSFEHGIAQGAAASRCRSPPARSRARAGRDRIERLLHELHLVLLHLAHAAK